MSESRELARLATLPRSQGKEEIRWSWDEFVASDGRVSKYVSARKWVLGTDGQWHPTRSGLTVRVGELDQVLAGLGKVAAARDAAEQGASPGEAQR